MKPSKIQMRLNARRHVERRAAARARSAEQQPALTPSKGKHGGNCNVTACQRPGAWFFNRGTNAYYCFDCAWDIHKFNTRPNSDDGFVLFPNFEVERAELEQRLRGVAA